MYTDFPLYDCLVVFITLYLLGIATSMGVSQYVQRLYRRATNKNPMGACP